MPPEVAAALRESGHWQDDNGYGETAVPGVARPVGAGSR